MSRVPDEKTPLRNNGVIDFQDSALALLPGDPYADPYGGYSRGLASDPYIHPYHLHHARGGLASDPYHLLHARGGLASDPYHLLHTRGGLASDPSYLLHAAPRGASDPSYLLHARGLAGAPDYLRESTPRDPYLRAPLSDEMEVQQGPPSFLKVDGQMYHPTSSSSSKLSRVADDEEDSHGRLSSKVDEYLSSRRPLSSDPSSSVRQTVADVNRQLAALSDRRTSPGLATRGLRPVRVCE